MTTLLCVGWLVSIVHQSSCCHPVNHRLHLPFQSTHQFKEINDCVYHTLHPPLLSHCPSSFSSSSVFLPSPLQHCFFLPSPPSSTVFSWHVPVLLRPPFPHLNLILRHFLCGTHLFFISMHFSDNLFHNLSIDFFTHPSSPITVTALAVVARSVSKLSARRIVISCHFCSDSYCYLCIASSMSIWRTVAVTMKPPPASSSRWRVFTRPKYPVTSR